MFEPKFANQSARRRGGEASARKAKRFDMEAAYRRWREMMNDMYGEPE